MKRMVNGYCSGGEEHDYQAGWDIRLDPRSGLGESDLFESLGEAWEYLAGALSNPPVS